MASKLCLAILVASGIALCAYLGSVMASEIYLPIPSSGRPAERGKPMANEPKAADRPTGPWFEARWQDPETGWHSEPYERFSDARNRARAEMIRGAQTAHVVHIPTRELIENINRAPEAPGARLGGRPPTPPR
jgi:hypothetical protein